ncbi:MAG: TMEM165/GDT1 family protein [Anaerolineae bacterium]|mgnify:CR=1 FL=1
MDWKVLVSTFGLLFLAELGDKTQLAVISMTAKHKAPLSVFLGAFVALGLVTLIGVVFGEALTRVVPEDLMRRVSAGFFILMGVLIWFKVF